MDISKLVQSPPIKASVTPIFWEPYQESGERIIPIYFLMPDSTAYGLEPSVFKTIRNDRLSALLGAARAASAEGILLHVSNFISQAVSQGHDPVAIKLPFQGFSFGKSKRIRAYSVQQLLNTAIRTASAFGNPDGMYDDEILENRHNSVPTRTFISALRTHYANNEKELKNRFYVPFRADNSPMAITIDYAHKSSIAQITSVPATDRQALYLQQEAESKLLELDLTFQSLKSQAHYDPKMILNSSVLEKLNTEEAKSLADDFIKRIQYMSKHSGVTLHQFATPQEGANFLRSLE